MALRVLALAPPQFPVSRGRSRALSSEDPASLFNACRWAAQVASAGLGSWSESNWASSRPARRDAVLMFESLDEATVQLPPRLTGLRPNLLLLGSMSICLPGAVACARMAKEYLGDGVCVVLGGRHATESIFTDALGVVRHHAGSPLRLMAEGAIPPVFDIVVAGDGEQIIVALGEVVARRLRHGLPAATAADELEGLAHVPGRWIAGAAHNGSVRTVVGRGPPLASHTLPPPCALFGVRARFEGFGGRPTAHVFSDVGGTCAYDCDFCSERRAAGPLRDLENSADRLFDQMACAARVIREDYPGAGASAFVEDSTLLTFVPRLVERFAARMAAARLDIGFGGQLTIDQGLSRPHLLPPLREAGLEYLFVGVETFSPTEVGG